MCLFYDPFARRVAGLNDLTIVYQYYVKSDLYNAVMSTKVSNLGHARNNFHGAIFGRQFRIPNIVFLLQLTKLRLYKACYTPFIRKYEESRKTFSQSSSSVA